MRGGAGLHPAGPPGPGGSPVGRRGWRAGCRGRGRPEGTGCQGWETGRLGRGLWDLTPTNRTDRVPGRKDTCLCRATSWVAGGYGVALALPHCVDRGLWDVVWGSHCSTLLSCWRGQWQLMVVVSIWAAFYRRESGRIAGSWAKHILNRVSCPLWSAGSWSDLPLPVRRTTPAEPLRQHWSA